jgi:hypothetical protein
MNLNILQESLFEKLRIFFQDFGYEYLPQKFQYRKLTEEGFQNVVYTIEYINDETWIELFLGARNTVIEHAAQQFLDTPKDYIADSNTIIASIGKLNNLKYFKYEITTKNDAMDTFEEIKTYFTEFGFEFLAKTNSIKHIEYLLNNKPKLPCKFVLNETNRYIKGLVAAMILKLDTSENIYKTYLTALLAVENNDIEVLKFNKIYAFLQYQSVN